MEIKKDFMKPKVDLKLLDEQIQFLDMYSDMITDEHKRELVDGVINLLDWIRYVVENDDELRFERVN